MLKWRSWLQVGQRQQRLFPTRAANRVIRYHRDAGRRERSFTGDSVHVPIPNHMRGLTAPQHLPSDRQSLRRYRHLPLQTAACAGVDVGSHSQTLTVQTA
jgi:hypothetical protein